MQLNNAGRMVENQWLKLPVRFQNIVLHEYVVMPNHFHAILEIVGATLVVVRNNNDVVRNNNDVVQNNNDVVRNDNDVVRNDNDVVRNDNDVVRNDNDVVRNDRNGQPQGIAPTGKTIGNIVGAFESITTVEYIRAVKNLGWNPFNGKLWQRNYYEHIIRDEQSYLKISDYIINNPSNWVNLSAKSGAIVIQLP